jgi:2-succinyl-6-hydroxy-2,4-cyclohexadiene-1-carboxylate synthase
MLSYFRRGQVNARPLVFLHGFLGCKEDWEEMVSELEHEYLCYCLDLPGHGESPFFPDLVQAVANAIASFSLDNVVLVGYSLGGRIALQIKKQFPMLASRLILLSAHPGLQDDLAKQQRWGSDKKWIHMLEEGSMEDFLACWYDQEIFAPLKKKKELFARICERRMGSNPKILAEVLKATSLANQPFILPEDESTLLLYGEEDLKFEALYHTLLASLEKRKIKSSGHAVHLENPGGTAYAIRDYLSSFANSVERSKKL